MGARSGPSAHGVRARILNRSEAPVKYVRKFRPKVCSVMACGPGDGEKGQGMGARSGRTARRSRPAGDGGTPVAGTRVAGLRAPVVDGPWIVMGKDLRLTMFARSDRGLLRWTQRAAAGHEWAGPDVFEAPRLSHLTVVQGADGFVRFIGRRVSAEGQTPGWLDTDVPGLTVVDHREIFSDPAALPTYNSHAIESQLHRIPGLSDHFLYLNDDVFFGRPVRSRSFHRNGLTKFFLSKALIPSGNVAPEDLPVNAAGKNSRGLIAQQFGAVISQEMKHTPHALLRSVLTEIEHIYARPTGSPSTPASARPTTSPSPPRCTTTTPTAWPVRRSRTSGTSTSTSATRRRSSG
ncbi:hypothetical protein SMICM304S_03707 [Streptomyces microflavus]